MLAFISSETPSTCAQTCLQTVPLFSVALIHYYAFCALHPRRPFAYASTPQTFGHAFQQHPAGGAVTRELNLAPSEQTELSTSFTQKLHKLR